MLTLSLLGAPEEVEPFKAEEAPDALFEDGENGDDGERYRNIPTPARTATIRQAPAIITGLLRRNPGKPGFFCGCITTGAVFAPSEGFSVPILTISIANHEHNTARSLWKSCPQKMGILAEGGLTAEITSWKSYKIGGNPRTDWYTGFIWSADPGASQTAGP